MNRGSILVFPMSLLLIASMLYSSVVISADELQPQSNGNDSTGMQAFGDEISNMTSNEKWQANEPESPNSLPTDPNTGRANVTIQVEGEPMMEHEGGLGNYTYLALLQQRHAQVKQDIINKGLNVTFQGDTYFVYNGIDANVLGSDLVALSTAVSVETVQTRPKFQIALDWSVPAIRADPANLGPGHSGAGIVIAVIDSGINANHPSLNDLFDDPTPIDDPKVIAFQDFTETPFDPDLDTPFDDHGHGTHVAGIAAGTGEGSPPPHLYRGVAPAAWLVGVKVCYASGQCDFIIQALNWIVGVKDIYDIGIATMSLGAPEVGDGQSDGMETAVRNTVNAGIVVTIAAGNAIEIGKVMEHRYQMVSMPGSTIEAITVGSYDDGNSFSLTDDELSDFSCWGPTVNSHLKPDVLAPGEDIWSASHLGGYIPHSGTSMATPHVAGAAALLLQEHPLWTPSDVKAALVNYGRSLTADPFPESDKVYASGAGSIDVREAMHPEALMHDVMRWPTSLSFGNYILDDAYWQKEMNVVLHDVRPAGAPSRYYAITIDAPDIMGAPGMNIFASVPGIPLIGGGSAVFQITMTINGALAQDGKYGGFVVAASTTESLRLPLFINVERVDIHIERAKTNNLNYVFFKSAVVPQTLNVEVSGPGPLPIPVVMMPYTLQAAHWATMSEAIQSPSEGSYTVLLHVTDPDGFSDTYERYFDFDLSTFNAELKVEEDGDNAIVKAFPSENPSTGILDDKIVNARFNGCISTACDLGPSMATDPTGRFVHMAWIREYHDPILLHWHWQVMYKRSDDFGIHWEQERILAPNTYNTEGGIKVATVENYVYVVYSTYAITPNTYKNIYIMISADRGANWNPPRMISGMANHIFWWPDIVARESYIHVVWEDWDTTIHTYPFSIRYRRSIDYGINWDDGLGNNQDRVLGQGTTPAVAASDDYLHVVYEHGEIFHRRSVYKGADWSNEVQITNSNLQIPPASATLPELAMVGNTIHLSYSETPIFIGPGNEFNWAVYRRSDDNGDTWHDGNGNPVGRRISTATGYGVVRATDIIASNSNIVVSWADFSSRYSWYPGWKITYALSADGGSNWQPPQQVSDVRERYSYLSHEIIWFSSAGLITEAPQMTIDSIFGIHFAWAEIYDGTYFGGMSKTYRTQNDATSLLYHTVFATVSLKVKVPDGRFLSYQMEPGADRWSATIPIEVSGLYTAEALMYDEFSNMVGGTTAFGYLEFGSNSLSLDESLYVHKDTRFSAAKLGIRGLYVAPAFPERRDQFQSVQQDGEGQILYDMDDKNAQGFQPAYPTLTGVKLSLYRTTGFDGSIWVEIREDDESNPGFPSDTILTAVVLSGGLIPPNVYTLMTVDIPDISVIVDRLYHIVIRFETQPGIGWPTNYIAWAKGPFNLDLYRRGFAAYNHDGVWLPLFNDDDRVFETLTKSADVDRDDQENSYPCCGGWAIDAIGDKLGQSFKPAFWTLTSMDIRMYLYDGFDADLFFEIRRDAGGLPSEASEDVLVRTVIPWETIPDIQDPSWWFNVDFSDLPVDIDTLYHVVIRPMWQPTSGIAVWLYAHLLNENYIPEGYHNGLYMRGDRMVWDGIHWDPDILSDFSFVGKTSNARAEMDDQMNSYSANSGQYVDDPSQKQAQGFEVSQRVLTAVSLYMLRTEDFDNEMIVEIRPEEGGYPSLTTYLARATIKPTDIPILTGGWVKADFERTTLDQSTPYYITLRLRAPLDPPGEFAAWGWNYDNLYPNGEAWTYYDNAWHSEGVVTDRMFKTFGAEANGETVDQHQLFDTGNGIGIWPDDQFAQYFIPTYPLVTGADIYIQNFDSTTDLIVEVQKHDEILDIPDGTALTRARVDVPYGLHWIHVDFADIRVDPDQGYDLVVKPQSTPDGTLIVMAKYIPNDDGVDTYISGRLYVYDHYWPDNWYRLDTWDMLFKVMTKAAEPETLDQVLDVSTYWGEGRSYGWRMSQSFIPSYNELSKIDLSLMRTDEIFDTDIVLEVVKDDGGEPGTDIAVRTKILGTALPLNSYTFVSVDISDALINRGEIYHIVLSMSRDPGGGKLFGWGACQDDLYPRGYAMDKSPSGSWMRMASDIDLLFRTYYRAPVGIVKDLALDVGLPSIDWAFAGPLWGSTETSDLSQAINDYIVITGIPDDLDYVSVPFIFESTTIGRIFVWGTKFMDW